MDYTGWRLALSNNIKQTHRAYDNRLNLLFAADMLDFRSKKITRRKALATDFTAVLDQARAYAAYSYARNTRLAYANDWKLFKLWCAEQQRRPLPATPETVLGYVVTLAEKRSVATIDRRLCGIAFYHRQERMADPTNDPEVEVTMRGIRRAKGTAANGKAPITTSLLRRLLTQCPATLCGQQARALLLLGYAGAFRRSELVALTITDIQFVDAGMIVTVRRSKTDQEGIGYTKGIPFGQDEVTCPVRALRAWMAVATITTGYLFRALDGHGRVREQPLPSYGVARTVQWPIKEVGLDPKQYGGHSLRSGLVTAAAQAGVQERIIMQQTGHTDVRSLRRYIRDGSLFRENAAAQVGL